MMDWFSDLTPFQAAFWAWRAGNYAEERHFQLTYQPDGPFLIAAGTGILVQEMRRFKLNSPEIVQRLGQQRDEQNQMLFDESFLNHLQRARFRGKLFAALEGSLLLAGEPVLVVQSSLLHGLLLKFILDTIIWKSTYYATEAAISNWKNGRFSETQTPHAPTTEPTLDGWKTRANFIGGGSTEATDEARNPSKNEGFQLVEIENPTAQIRRLFNGSEPLADVFLTDGQEELAAEQKNRLRFHNQISGATEAVRFSRFQNLWQPVLLDGHPTFASPSLDYLRQRTFKNLEVFQKKSFGDYPRGYFEH